SRPTAVPDRDARDGATSDGRPRCPEQVGQHPTAAGGVPTDGRSAMLAMGLGRSRAPPPGDGLGGGAQPHA
ncbi:MAG: hypothetical protein ACRDSK_09020, partial [Actinophytocola sp.]|uniref:hypothetical protein n=1 Tax=Actinophytocola sp. TaxID=1872138 RepID=UPI003D6A8F00